MEKDKVLTSPRNFSRRLRLRVQSIQKVTSGTTPQAGPYRVIYVKGYY